MAVLIPGIPITKFTAGLSAASPSSPNTRRYPLSYAFSGTYVWGYGSLLYQDSRGYWWSTAAYNDSEAYNLYMNSSSLNPQSYYGKVGGFSLRCVSYSTKYPSVSAFVCIVRVLLLG